MAGALGRRSRRGREFLAAQQVIGGGVSIPSRDGRETHGQMETIRGAFFKFLSPPGKSGNDSGLAVVRYESSGQLVEAKVSGPFSPMVQENEWIVAEGEWRENSFRGKGEMIFRARSVHPDLPATKVGAAQLFVKTFTLADHGISSKSVEAFTAKHGDSSALKAEADPRLLLEMSSDPSRHGAAIFRDWARRISGRQSIRLMESAGVADRSVKAILRHHRDNTQSVMNRNPYAFASLPAVGFAEADKIGAKLGVARDDVRRVAAAVVDVVADEDGEGHTYIPFSAMRDGLEKNGVDVEAMRRLISSGGDTGLVFDREDGAPVAQKKHLHDSERSISVSVAKLVERGRSAQKGHIDAVAAEVLGKDKYSQFDSVQRAAVLMAARESVSVLTGGPGTGKSTVTEAIAEIAAATAKGPVILMAPTGKAARRLEETTGRTASTVHKALGATGEGGARFAVNRSNPLPAGCFVVVDEASMLDVEVAASLLEALPPDGRILFVGDRHQLPSVGPGYVLGDMIAAVAPNGGRVPVAELLTVYRNKKGSMIAHGAAGIREGTFETGALDNVMRGGVMMYDLKASAITDRVVHLMSKLIPKSLKLDAMKDVAVLCPQRTGAGGTWELNAALSRALNPRGQAIDGLVHGPDDNKRMPLPRVGDRVMLTRNDYDNDVMNGDVGTLVEAYLDASGPRKEKKVKVRFDSGPTVSFPLSRCRDLILAYAITGHKSQGSQYPCVVMPLSLDHANMLDRTLAYTEWTRAKDFLILVGEEEALAMAVGKTSSSQRRTRLKRFLEHTLGQLPLPSAAAVTGDDFSSAPSPARKLSGPPSARQLRLKPVPAVSRHPPQPPGPAMPRFKPARPPSPAIQHVSDEDIPAPRP